MTWAKLWTEALGVFVATLSLFFIFGYVLIG